MRYEEKNYLPRIVDKQIQEYLSIFGAISIEGPKWCGKTWAGKHISKSVYELDNKETKDLADTDPQAILHGEEPSLIDEWSEVPSIWDAVRRECDSDDRKGKYILTCSTSLNDEKKKKIFHSGAGRIGKIEMYTMSLYESGDSTGEASIADIYDGIQKNKITKEVSLDILAKLIIRGGFPGNLNVEHYDILPKQYIESILDKDIYDDKYRDRRKMMQILKSLARNESTIATIKTIRNDTRDIDDDKSEIGSEKTINDYIDVLERLHIVKNQDAYSENYRSRERIGKASKRHLIDPSLTAALLQLTSQKLLDDLKTFGFLFEALVERDLRIYIESLGGKLYHFRDSVLGIEVDSILEFPDGEYAAIEIKLGYNDVEDAKRSLLKYCDKTNKKPRFMCVIVGVCKSIVKDKDTGIWIVPITALKP